MHSSDARLLRGAAIPTAAAAVLAVVVGLLIDGGKGALGAAVGGLVVLGFFSISLFAVGYAAKISPQLVTGAALLSYVTKLGVLLVMLLLFKDTELWNTLVFGYTIVALTVVWIAFEIRALLQVKTLELTEVPVGDRR